MVKIDMNFQRHKGLKKMMKIRIAIVLLFYCAATSVVYAHGKTDADTARNNNYTGTIYLHGEQHSVKKNG